MPLSVCLGSRDGAAFERLFFFLAGSVVRIVDRGYESGSGFQSDLSTGGRWQQGDYFLCKGEAGKRHLWSSKRGTTS